MIYTLTLNPGLDRTLTVNALTFNEVLRASAVRLDWGGKGLNVCRALRVLGEKSIATGFLGGATGTQLQSGLSEMGIQTAFINIAAETRTNIVITEPGGRHLKVNEPGPLIPPDALEDLCQFVSQAARPGDWWALCGSGAPGISPDYYASLVSLLQGRSIRVALDTSGEMLRQGLAAQPYLVKPNLSEAQEATGIEIRSESDQLEAGRRLLEAGVQMAALSSGAGGLLLVTRYMTLRVCPPKVDAISPLAAGDALLAGLVWVLHHGGKLEEAARWGVASGTACAMTPGSGMGTRKLIEDLYSQIEVTRIE